MKTTGERHPCRIGRVSLLVVAIMVTIDTHAQKINSKVFEDVPASMRTGLVERLALYVEYERTGQHDKLYELLSQSTIQKIYKGQTKAEFVEAGQKGDARCTSTRLLNFTPTAIQKITDENGADLYVIYGKAKLLQAGRRFDNPRVVVDAQIQNGDWYFSTVGFVLID